MGSKDGSDVITPPAGVRVYLACGSTDMRNYAECIVMRSGARSLWHL